MRLRLHIPYEFHATHSLAGHEAPHGHLWRCRVSFEGQPVNGKIVDLPSLEHEVEKQLKDLSGTYLNDNLGLTEATRAFPTSEGLASDIFLRVSTHIVPHFHAQNPSLHLVGVSVTLCDEDGQREWGTAEALPGEDPALRHGRF